MGMVGDGKSPLTNEDRDGEPKLFLDGYKGLKTKQKRCMVAIFHDIIEETMEVFMDDFLVFGDSFSSCLSYLEKMLKRCEDTNLVLNWEKCHFMVKEGIILGHKISKSRIEVDRAKVDVIAKLPHLTSVKGAVLGKRKTKHFHPIHYASKTMTDAQAHYTTMEKELLAVTPSNLSTQRNLISEAILLWINTRRSENDY
ncbi:reverse transcriptase domain-containing protein [Tanacetum coccineum]